MMGVTHATSGAAVWIATTGLLPLLSTGIHPLPASTVLAGSIVAAGAALLPDIDHHSATIAHSVPVLGRLVAGAAGTLSGGHRHGFHAPVVLVGVWFLFSWLSTWNWELPGGRTVAAGVGLTALALCCFGMKARGYVSTWPRSWLIGALFAVTVLLMTPEGEGSQWLPLAVTLGYATHLVGDVLTTGGLPVLGPLVVKPPRWWRGIPVLSDVWKSNGYVAVPLLGDAGSLREKLLGAVMTTYVGYGTLAECWRLLGL